MDPETSCFFEARMQKLLKDPKNFETVHRRTDGHDRKHNPSIIPDSSRKHQRRFTQVMPRSKHGPFELRPGAERYYTKQDVLDRVNFSRATLIRRVRNKSMPAPVEAKEMNYGYLLWLREEIDKWLEQHPQFDREKKAGSTRNDVRLHFKNEEMHAIRLASQCAHNIEADTEKFIKTAVLLYSNQVLRLTYDDLITQEQRKDPDLNFLENKVLLRRIKAWHAKQFTNLIYKAEQYELHR